jgi:hypothetical protein
MNRTGASVWQVILAVGAVLLVGGLIVSGQLMFGVVLLVLFLILGGGALLYRTRGPAEP